MGTRPGTPDSSRRRPGSPRQRHQGAGRTRSGLSGCYYQFEGKPITWFADITNWGNKSAPIYLIDGSRDTVCPAWQTEKFAASLRAAGYNVKLVELEGANHFAPVFHDLRDGRWQVIMKDPAGEQAVNTIITAITAARANAAAN